MRQRGVTFALIALAGVSLQGCDDPLDTTKVLAVEQSPDGRKAAVIASRSRANSSSASARLFVTDPSAADAKAIAKRQPHIVLAGAGDDTQTRASFRLAWTGDVLAVCVDPARLRYFSATSDPQGDPSSQANVRLESCEGWDKRHPGR